MLVECVCYSNAETLVGGFVLYLFFLFEVFLFFSRGIFFFVCSYSHATLLDHGGVLVNHFFPSAVGRAQWQQPVPSALAFPSRELNPGSRGYA